MLRFTIRCRVICCTACALDDVEQRMPTAGRLPSAIQHHILPGLQRSNSISNVQHARHEAFRMPGCASNSAAESPSLQHLGHHFADVQPLCRGNMI